MRPFGTQSTQTRLEFAGIVDLGWRVASAPSRVGMRARVPEAGRRQ